MYRLIAQEVRYHDGVCSACLYRSQGVVVDCRLSEKERIHNGEGAAVMQKVLTGTTCVARELKDSVHMLGLMIRSYNEL